MGCGAVMAALRDPRLRSMPILPPERLTRPPCHFRTLAKSSPPASANRVPGRDISAASASPTSVPIAAVRSTRDPRSGKLSPRARDGIETHHRLKHIDLELYNARSNNGLVARNSSRLSGRRSLAGNRLLETSHYCRVKHGGAFAFRGRKTDKNSLTENALFANTQ